MKQETRYPIFHRGGRALALAHRAAPKTTGFLAVVGLLGSGLPVVAAWLMKAVLDGISSGVAPASGGGMLLLVLLVFAGVFSAVLPHVKSYLKEELDRSVSARSYDTVYKKINQFVTLARFEDPKFLDRLRLAQQAGVTAPGAVVTALLGSVAGLVTACGFIVSLWLLSPVLAVTLVLSIVPVALVEFYLGSRRAEVLHLVAPLQRREFFYRELIANNRAAKELRLYGTGDFFRQRMMADRRLSDSHQRALARKKLGAGALTALAGAAAAGLALAWSVRSAWKGELTVGDVSMLIAAVAGVQTSASGLVETFARTHESLILFGHYLFIIDLDLDVPAPVRPRSVVPLRWGIEIRDVWFRYSDDAPWVLEGASLFIPHGSTVGIVGKNGAGKSTLVKLLCRFHDPTRGAIYWDGVDIRDIPAGDLRRRIGAVFQDFMFYDLSAAENIGIGDVERISDGDRVRKAAELAGIHGVLSGLPLGYQTLLSRIFFSEEDKNDPKTGVMLSGGQWQRVALARGLMRDERDFLILDEPTSGLDPEAEKEVGRRIAEFGASRTSLLITHRLGSIRESDAIAVLAGGRIVELGTHDELISAAGTYAELFAMQADGYVGP
ncbi:ABC transporter ATP-binding protein [Kitasatospora hibisci]|uniref:ABC transporter ATP-binding protein n=1 Tax=Kitasatospora hibisci TaxID=3369522 RepID=UPI0037552E22